MILGENPAEHTENFLLPMSAVNYSFYLQVNRIIARRKTYNMKK